MSQPSDEALLERFAQHKDRKAFDTVYNRYFFSLCKYLGWLTQESDTGADIAQNIFLKLLEQPQVFDTRRNFKVWLYSSAKNQWKNELRNRSTRAGHLKTLTASDTYFTSELEDKDNRLKAVFAAVNQLNEIHREVFVLKYSNGLSIQEISEVCQLAEGTVKSRIFNALQQIKKHVSTRKTPQT